jgi:purine-binding chemotaxis protein CheW|nr:chemotaxis protein CheW [Kofleriaceae bacterium]
MSDHQLCTFKVADLVLGVEVTRVQEVIRSQPLTRVPLAPPTVAGLLNLRGQIVTAIDLRARLGVPPRDPSVPPMNVVVRHDGGAVSLLVDDIGDVIEVADATFEAPPDTIGRAARELIRGAYKLPDHLLLVLDAARAIEASPDLERDSR